jgi:transposase-like protein
MGQADGTRDRGEWVMEINPNQLRSWALQLRQAADAIHPPHEMAQADQFEASLPDNPSLEEVRDLASMAGEHWIWASNLRSIAGDMESWAAS